MGHYPYHSGAPVHDTPAGPRAEPEGQAKQATCKAQLPQGGGVHTAPAAEGRLKQGTPDSRTLVSAGCIGAGGRGPPPRGTRGRCAPTPKPIQSDYRCGCGCASCFLPVRGEGRGGGFGVLWVCGGCCVAGGFRHGRPWALRPFSARFRCEFERPRLALPRPGVFTGTGAVAPLTGERRWQGEADFGGSVPRV